MSMGRARTAVGVGAGVAVLATSLMLAAFSAASAPPAASATPAGSAAPLIPVPSPTPGSGAGQNGAQSSTNWAGYAVTGATFTSVSGAWGQPAATCRANKAQLAAFWVGLDGYAASDPAVEQIGTDSDCVKAKGKAPGGPSYYAWFEMYPAPPMILSPHSYPVAPGDTISASVSASGSGFLLRLDDVGKWSYSSVQTPRTHPQEASAEWIAEAPSTCRGSSCRVSPLADFSAIGFSGARADGFPVSTLPNSRITMTTGNGKKVKADVSALSSSGTSFVVAWKHS